MGFGNSTLCPINGSERVLGLSPLILNPLSAFIVTASDPAGPSYAAATLQASSAASSASPVSRAIGSTSKVKSSDFGGVEEERSWRPNPSPSPQPQESPKGKRKLDLNQEEKKTPSKPPAQLSPSVPKRPKCKLTRSLVPIGACAPVA